MESPPKFGFGVGRPKKMDDEKVKRTALKFHTSNADRFRNFVMQNHIDTLDNGLVYLLDFFEEKNPYAASSRPVR